MIIAAGPRTLRKGLSERRSISTPSAPDTAIVTRKVLPRVPASASPVVTRVTELKESNSLEEARAFISDGHQAVFHDAVEEWYAAGCPNVWFSVSRDFNGKREPGEVIVELPKDKAKRAKCYDILKKFYERLRNSANEQVPDDGEPYMEVELR